MYQQLRHALLQTSRNQQFITNTFYVSTKSHGAIFKNVNVTALRTSSLDFQKGYDRGVKIMCNRSPGRTNFIGAAPNTCCGSRSLALASRHRSGVWNFDPQPGFLKSSCTPRYVSNRSDASTDNQKKANHFCIIRYWTNLWCLGPHNVTQLVDNETIQRV
jgi:hypothetical protein